ncbi:F-box domain-containing protein [Coprinopsis sp. MPI-PUGE-AT-0042]|nr:F-box domain-containing protein [Coprinopsis sp. MPI-PUGE-AT-0042]
MEQYSISNDDNVFEFDPCEDEYQRPYPTSPPCVTNAARDSGNAATMRSHDAPLASRKLSIGSPPSSSSSSKGKGKAPAIPVPIPYTAEHHDLFDMSRTQMSPASSSSLSPSALSSLGSTSFAFSPANSSFSSYGTTLSSPMSEMMDVDEGPFPYQGASKGKAADTPPTLPPLTFTPSAIGDGSSEWMSFGQPSSLSSTFYSPAPQSSAEPSTSPLSPSAPSSIPRSLDSPLVQYGVSSSEPGSSKAPIRHNSLSNLSIASEVTIKKVKTPPPYRPQGFIARKLAFGKGTPTPSRPTSPPAIDPEILRYDNTAGKGLRVWYTSPKHDDPSAVVSRPPAPIPSLTSDPISLSARKLLRHKGRSHSEPVAFSALDFVPATSTDVFEPLPLFVKNYFDDNLPREIHLHILRCFVENYIDDHRRLIGSNRWSASKAASSKNQWVGKERGVRDLLKLARVSKSWCSAVFDGQLWTDLDLHGFPRIPHHILERITKSGGPFVQSLDLSGHTHLNSERLIELADSLCLPVPEGVISRTQLTSISLRGCRNLTTRSLHHLLLRSGSLERLNLKGLGCVTNTTCEILATYCPRLTSLNLGQCPNMGAAGIRFMANAVLTRKERLQLVELRLCGLKYITDSTMEALGRAAPFLEVLDLSYARQLHNSALEAFVACDDDEDNGADTVSVTARDLGRESSEHGPFKFRRRITRLRHLNLSFCVLLTDTACANISHSVPKLEILEMAGIGSHLKDAGLIRLLERTPFIQRLDLEDAMDVTDAFLATITPPPPKPATPSTSDSDRAPLEPPHTGHALQHLVVSYASILSDAAFLALIRNCSKLVTLEADNTRIGHSVLREFVRLSKTRRATNARIVAVDCRGIGESVTKELSALTRPRMGWRSFEARRLHYLDARDGGAGAEEDMKVGRGQDECDEKRVVVKTFYGWQTVDAVKANREKRRTTKGGGTGSGRKREGSSGTGDLEEEGGRRVSGTRWWSPSGRRSGSTSPPIMTDVPNDGCRTM